MSQGGPSACTHPLCGGGARLGNEGRGHETAIYQAATAFQTPCQPFSVRILGPFFFPWRPRALFFPGSLCPEAHQPPYLRPVLRKFSF